ncbi:hypothetical protein [Legionella septentrionalis]|uniref:hypothetical protein n=1 Tax=Legionella septentrionalis TaxID=2498109 RepID=UPI0013155787|nr:hypothetical protein [Legionella septentrionalis]
MNNYRLSMRKAHGEKGTFFEGFGENLLSRKTNKKTFALLKFRHTQYAPLGASN